jgi:phospholipase/lecithinase/hemolysin
MPTALQNLIIFGDSLSDIGIKRETPTGMFARAAGAMRTNEIGRYSDGRNWTDFLIEWTGAEPLVMIDAKTTEDVTALHRSLTNLSFLSGTQATGTRDPRLHYANYAEGGAVAASDWTPMAGALGYLKDEFAAYIKARQALVDKFSGETMHIVWIGLNDIVTAKRSEGNEPGTGITPIVAEIKSLIDSIGNAFPGSRDRDHFMLVDLPSPTISVRFMNQMADDKRKDVDRFEKNTVRFNELLEFIATQWPRTDQDVKKGPGAKKDNISLVQMYKWLKHVADNAEAYQVTELAQPPGIPVLYGHKNTDSIARAIRRCLTTSDLAHPTEAVYELIARKIVDDLLVKYTLGKLDRGSWPAQQPYSKVPSV